MLETILVPLDGSRLAQRALPYAERLARATGARLLLMALVPTRTARGPTAEAARAQLDHVAGCLAARGLGVERLDITASAGVRSGPAWGQRRVDLVVLAVRRAAGAAGQTLSRRIEAMLPTTDVPLLLVSPACRRTWPTDRALRVLVTIDPDLIWHLLGPVRTLATELDADLLLLEVAVPPDYGLRGRSRLVELSRRLREEGRAVEAYTAVGKLPAAVAQVAREQEADLVVLAVRGAREEVVGATLASVRVPLLLVLAQHGAPDGEGSAQVGSERLNGRDYRVRSRDATS